LGTAAGMIGGAGAGSVGIGDTLATRFSRSAQQAKAGNVLLKSAQDPAAFRDQLNNPAPGNIPDEAPTTYQATGDEGIGQLEQEVRAAAPAAFTERAAQQAEAQLAAKAAIQSGAAPEDVGNYFTAQARALNDQWQSAHEQATQQAQNRTTGVGQGQPASSAGQAISNELTPQYLDIQNAAKGQVNALGGEEPVGVYGGSMRLQARAAADDAQDRLRALYAAVPKDVTASIAPLHQTVQSIYGDMEPAARATVTPMETAVVDTIGQYPSSVPFHSAQAIDTLITSNMRNELKSAGYATPAYGRMVQLKGAWENAMSGSVAERAAQDNAAVAAGTMAPQDTIAATIQGWVANHYAQKDALGTSGVGAVGNAGAGTSGALGSSGTARQARGSVGGASGPQGIPSQALGGGSVVGDGGSWGGGGPFFNGPFLGGGSAKAPFASGGSVTKLPSYAYGLRRADGRVG
jgi:hypothetical protein